MKKNHIVFFIALFSLSVSAQEDLSDETTSESIFTDFRIPIRENVNESDLRYDGWKTDPAMYAYRCSDNKRIRMTLWYLTEGDENTRGSEFVNITPAIGECQKDDLEYTLPSSEKNKEEKETEL